MGIHSRRVLLAILALIGAYTGGWAYFAPHQWYRDFPGFGLSWLPQLGPYNEHLATDAGAMFLALFVLSLFALGHVRNNLVSQATGLAWLTFDVLHLIFHFRHLDVYGTLDVALNVVALTMAVLVPAGLLVPIDHGDGASR
ncbi:hypothetical protein DB35_01650 [Streptomyces abyssalis]|uniref:Uncharacterized protein n=1 Tax=Streptomyces abyssalis TaxID=933944 RepID=A0A1E7JFG5_9ACTN|nr:hypothetical protein [Streptomyces abyssalis]OEU85205.1 hypothetical protein AN215_21565 [Streptomyces abyssalis]OEU95626.1 hypothetical protein DB35_01650 [Streptomyces abyssalis]OEV04001.1 hypothetical protein AN219_37525 [Streptomyces nanshensis]